MLLERSTRIFIYLFFLFLMNNKKGSQQMGVPVSLLYGSGWDQNCTHFEYETFLIFFFHFDIISISLLMYQYNIITSIKIFIEWCYGQVAGTLKELQFLVGKGNDQVLNL
eukprot:TRINITY_DN68273_c0_g1_i1.p6 TRINITY_DN68273_c0_g1~~TRINITY_DN68273_c0_g1_i1.p6  ORF type:complete len:110 (-),score=6.15 TRINITY_DN68273_c0_g1_i1:707-1036(-)